MDPPPPPRTSPWNISWKAPVAALSPTPDGSSTSSAMGIGTAQALASFPGLMTAKLTKAELRVAKKQAPPLPIISSPELKPTSLDGGVLSTPDLKPAVLDSVTLSTPDLITTSLEDIPPSTLDFKHTSLGDILPSTPELKPSILDDTSEVSPLGRSSNRSPLCKSPERFDHRGNSNTKYPERFDPRGIPINESPQRSIDHLSSETMKPPRKHKNIPCWDKKSGESSTAGHVGQNSEASSSLVPVPALPSNQDKAKSSDEQNNALTPSKPDTRFPEVKDTVTFTRDTVKEGLVTPTNFEGILKSTDQQEALKVVPQLDNATILTQGHNKKNSESATPLTSLSIEDSKIGVIQPNSEDRSHTPPVSLAPHGETHAQSKFSRDKTSSYKVQAEDTNATEIDETKEFERMEIEANDIETMSGFDNEMVSAPAAETKPGQGFQFLPLIDDSTYGPLPTAVSSSLVVGASAFGEEVRLSQATQSIFADEPPARYLPIPFSGMETPAFHPETNDASLAIPEQRGAYNPPVQGSGSGSGSGSSQPPRHQRFRPENVGRGKQPERRRSISCVVDVATLQEAVSEDPDQILDRIKVMKDEIEDLRSRLGTEEGILKWTVHQYEALQTISIGKQIILWKHIGRLNDQIKSLIDNQGQEHTQAPTSSNCSPSLSRSELASYVEGEGSEQFDSDVERKGTARRNSLENNSRLDPNADPFVPSEVGSPATGERAYPPTPSPHSFNGPSSYPMKIAGTLPTRTAAQEPAETAAGPSNSSPSCKPDGPSTSSDKNSGALVTAAPANPGSENQPVSRGRIIQPPFDTMSPPTLALILASIPPFWRAVCPISLCSESQCTNPRCTLREVCRTFNYLGPPMACRNNPCPRLHFLKTCEQEVEGLVCEYTVKGSDGSFPRGAQRHKDKRMHRGNCPEEEWRVRFTLGGLRSMHASGTYMG